MVRPLERRLQLVTGKGGTGKTTLVAALALAHAERGRKPLAVEHGHRASLASVLDVAPIDHVIREVLPGVHATNLESAHATHELVRRALPSRVTTRLLRASPVRAFLDASPGVVEVAILDRLRYFVDETDFDPILVDGDATGHTRMLFALHGVLASLGVAGPVRALLDRTSSLFADPELAAIHLTALPTSLAIEETLELWDELSAEHHVALGHVLLGRVEGRDAASIDDEELARLERAAGETALASALGLLRVDRERGRRASDCLRQLAAHGMDARAIDEIDTRRLTADSLRAMGRALLDAGGTR